MTEVDATASTSQTIGFVDIGTNSVRLLVARVDEDRSWRTITLQKERARLGEGEFGAASMLQPAAIERALVVCRSFVDLAKAHDAQTVVGVATAATREARNRNLFVRRLRDEAGLHVHVVSGKEEARLIFLGVLTRVNLGERRGLVVDIGGGSTEIAFGDATGAIHVDSLNVGGIKLTSEFPEAALGPVPADVFEAMRRRVQVPASRSRRKLSGEHSDIVYGTSGTIRNLTAVAARLRDPDDERPRDVLLRAELKKVAKLLRTKELDERRAIPGLNPDRGDTIVAGAAILDAVMEELGVEEIHALPECGLREGLVLDYLAREAGMRSGRHPDVRERSVLHLARATAFDESHARHVADLAMELFDSASAVGLHRCGPAERELFYYSALLHDIGAFLNYSEHHQHSAYLIRNADLLGFDQSEIALMAALALFHRKGRPKPRNSALADLDAPARKAVRVLSTLLRIAEYLDRGHSGAIAHVSLVADGKRSLLVEVQPVKDWDLERWRLASRIQAIEESLSRTLRVREASPQRAT